MDRAAVEKPAETHNFSGRDSFLSVVSLLLPEGAELLRAALGENEVFRRRFFSVGLETSERGSCGSVGGKDTSFCSQSESMAPMSAWYGGALQPSLPGLSRPPRFIRAETDFRRKAGKKPFLRQIPEKLSPVI